MTNAHVEGALVRRFLGHAPQGAAEARYFKGNLLAPLAKAHEKIPLQWNGVNPVRAPKDEEG